MVRLKEVKNPVYLSVKLGGNLIVTLGSKKQVCDAFGVAEPLFAKNIPMVIKDKFGADSRLISASEFRSLRTKIQDSSSGVIFI